MLNAAQQTAFENYIRAGGGYAGVHSAADTEYGWAWYGELIGAYFASHPAIQQATIEVADQVHASTAHLPDRWVRTDEWYNYQANPRGDVHVLMTLDESTYSGGVGGNGGFDHPISWYHYFDGGRSWYTGLGHTAASYCRAAVLAASAGRHPVRRGTGAGRSGRDGRRQLAESVARAGRHQRRESGRRAGRPRCSSSNSAAP